METPEKGEKWKHLRKVKNKTLKKMKNGNTSEKWKMKTLEKGEKWKH